MRTTKELLELLLKHIESGYFKQYNMIGLCHLTLILNMKGDINGHEASCIYKYIQNNRPKNLWYYLSLLFEDLKIFYWIPEKTKPRIKWLKKHILLN